MPMERGGQLGIQAGNGSHMVAAGSQDLGEQLPGSVPVTPFREQFGQAELHEPSTPTEASDREAGQPATCISDLDASIGK